MPNPLFVLVSGSFQVMDTPHSGDVFGQVLELPQAIAHRAVQDGAALLPKELFDTLGFTVQEIAAWPNAKVRAEAPAEFQAKFKAALEALHVFRASLAGEI